MKHESNDTLPFAPDDPISRSLFVRPNLIERLCASALRLCLLVCIPAAASVFLISLADSAEAACTSEPSQHYEVTTLIADHPVQTSSDPDFEEILKANARIAVESGEWSHRVKRKEETLIQWMRSPVFPEFRPMAVKTTLIRRPTGLSVEDIRRAELFNDVSRLLLFFDSRAGGQVNFAMRMLSTASFAIRPVVAAGSVAFAQEKLGMRVWADQGSVLTRRLGLNHWPALVKLTPSEISVWTPALNADGIPDSPVPTAFASGPAGTALEPSSATIAPRVREVEKAPSTELAAAPSASSSPEAFSDSKSDNSNTWRPRITILLDTGMTSSLVETAAEELKLVGDAADVEVLVRGLPVTRTPTGYRTDFEATSERLAPLVDAGFGAAIHPERFAFLLALAEEGLEAGGRLDAKTEEVYEVMTAAPTAPAVLLTIGRSVYAVSGTASIVSALSQWRRTLADAVMDESDRTRIAALQTVLDETPLGRIAP